MWGKKRVMGLKRQKENDPSCILSAIHILQHTLTSDITTIKQQGSNIFNKFQEQSRINHFSGEQNSVTVLDKLPSLD